MTEAKLEEQDKTEGEDQERQVKVQREDNPAQTVDPSPTTTLSASLSAQEEEPTVKYEAAGSSDANANVDEIGSASPAQPAEEPSDETEEHPQAQDAPRPGAPSSNELSVQTVIVVPDQTQDVSHNEEEQWRAAGWVHPDEWAATPTDEQLAAWRSNGWLTQEDIEERTRWAEAGWRFD